MINLFKKFLRYIFSFGNLTYSLYQLKEIKRKKSNTFIIILGSFKRINTLTMGAKNFIHIGKKYNIIFLRKHNIFSNICLFFFDFLKILRDYKLIKIISDDKAQKGKWDFSLEWNNYQGVKGDSSRAIFMTDDVTKSKNNQPLKLFLPIISQTNSLRNNIEPMNPIYIGIIGGMKLLEVSIEEANEDSLIYDQTDLLISKNINQFTKRRSSTRLYFVKELKKHYGDWFELRGIGWDKYQINSKSIERY